MKYPNFREERKLYNRGYRLIVGVDEVGRGALCGPVVACAITLFQNPKPKTQNPKIKDSKKLTAKQREEIYKILKQNPDIEWGIGRVSEKVIDRINILQATKLAMKRAVNNLEKKCSGVDFLLIDGNFGIDLDIAQRSIIKADKKIFSCAAASIIAKVFRDRMMVRYHKRYPQYLFDKHKGYGTEFHRRVIKEKGFCNIHRKSFRIS